MKRVIFITLMAFSIVAASAQGNLGISGGVLFPTEDGVKTGFGGTVSGEYLISPNIGLGVNVGYYIFGNVDVIMVDESVTIGSVTPYLIPTFLTGKYYFLTENIKPYAGVDIGLYTEGVRATTAGITVSVSKSFFGLAPVAGVQLKLSDVMALDINAKYTSLFYKGESTGYPGFNVGLVYSFGK
jgi:outer membrane protein W